MTQVRPFTTVPPQAALLPVVALAFVRAATGASQAVTPTADAGERRLAGY